MASSAELTAAINALSPLAYWTCTETSGTTLAQTGSSTASAMTMSGSYTLGSKELIVGDASRYPFATQALGTATRGNLTAPLTTCTLTFLLELTTVTGAIGVNPVMFYWGNTGETEATNAQLSFYLNDLDFSVFSFTESGAGVNDVPTFPDTMGTKYPIQREFRKYHIALTRDATSKVTNLFVDGVFRSSTAITNNVTGGTSTVLNIFNEVVNTRASTPMALGHVAIFGSVLTNQQIYDLAVASGYAPAEYRGYSWTVDTPDTELTNVSPGTIKEISAVIDPMVDYTIIHPEAAYNSY